MLYISFIIVTLSDKWKKSFIHQNSQETNTVWLTLLKTARSTLSHSYQTTHPGSEVHVGVAKAEAEGRVRDVHDVHSGDHISQIPSAGRWSLELHPGFQTPSSYARAWTPSHSSSPLRAYSELHCCPWNVPSDWSPSCHSPPQRGHSRLKFDPKTASI